MLVPVLPLRPLWHMGSLHPYEQWLTLLLAFGPFVLLGVVVWLRSREDRTDAEAAVADDGPRADESPSDPADRG